MRIAAVVVTYNRKELLKENIEALQKQTRKPDGIIIIDNHSTDGTEEWIRSSGYLSHSMFHYLRLSENTGSSGGFHEGVKYAYENNFDWIWGMDDDALPAENALEELLRFASNSSGCCFASNYDNDDKGFTNDLKKIDHWMFVGFFIKREIVEKVGFPRKDLFIYNDDLDYARRIQKAGYSIFKVRTSIIHHKDYSGQTIRKRTLFGKEYSFPMISNWKLYYLTRNRLLVFSYKEIAKYRAFIGVWRTIGIPLLMTNPSQFKYFLKGYIHGLLGISGKVLKPELSHNTGAKQ